jgi:hypothetical protein
MSYELGVRLTDCEKCKNSPPQPRRGRSKKSDEVVFFLNGGGESRGEVLGQTMSCVFMVSDFLIGCACTGFIAAHHPRSDKTDFVSFIERPLLV